MIAFSRPAIRAPPTVHVIRDTCDRFFLKIGQIDFSLRIPRIRHGGGEGEVL